jgi:hypothetical protein
MGYAGGRSLGGDPGERSGKAAGEREEKETARGSALRRTRER